ncbi:LUD domain-containing protein [Halomicrococcus sp. NG-SE-24]|uniref:LUD domain-containing protein n=1 Tax=Halomicrococcus sp. NG-SE-24 TaxID=3436928 RepID=UPI003D971B35
MSETESRRQKAQRIRTLLDTEGDAIWENTTYFNQEKYNAIESVDEYEDLRDQARATKEDAIENLPELIEQVEEAVTANGGHVHLADDAAEARKLVAELADDAETVVKSKSMTTEEIELNDQLARDGTDVWETDLGEFVLQVADETPSHIVGPSLHKSQEEIARLFNEQFDPEEPFETAEELTNFARDFLGKRICEADVGITGANFIAADSGTLMLVTNEGNARKSAVTPDTHIAVAGVEKLVPSVGDFKPFMELISRAATGQDIPQYLTLLSPPVDTPTLDFEVDSQTGINEDSDEERTDDRAFHLVLIDNGRMAMREDDQLRETLYCIRCGACANSCANFQHVGGHAFGGETYTGGIATGWEAGIEGEEAAAEFNDLCTGCSRCVNNCPVKIDIPWINTVVRDRINRGEDAEVDWLVEGLTPDKEPGGVSLRKRFFGNFETVAKVGSATAPVSNWIADLAPVRTLFEELLGIDQRRSLPAFKRETLRDWFENRGGSHVAPTQARREAVLYPDTYTNHVHTERGKAAIRTLEALNVSIHIPDIPASGRAPLSQGMIATAENRAETVADTLEPYIDRGCDIVVIEPSDAAMFEREYEQLLPEVRHNRLQEQSYEVVEYVYGLLTNGADADTLVNGNGQTVAYHGHCQQRTLGLDAYTEAVLGDLDYDVVTSDVECCGMAGSFGYKTEYYELSIDVGEDLQVEFADVDGPVAASGTSCLEQLQSLLDRPVYHPLELVGPTS